MPEWHIWIWVLAAVTGFLHSKQAAMADYYRNIHLLFLKGESGSELSNSSVLKENYKKLRWKKDFIYKFFETFYISYTRGQEQMTPAFQRLIKLIRERYGKQIPEQLQADFRKKSLPLMKYTNMLSFNTRTIALFISLLINRCWLYFVFEMTVLTLILCYMVHKHETFCKELHKEIIANKYT